MINNLRESIQTYLTPERFERNIYLNSESSYIDYLAAKLVASKHIEPAFIELIKEREKMSVLLLIIQLHYLMQLK
ncbi:hypothetical protein GQR36_24210 [Enterococcus termitis]